MFEDGPEIALAAGDVTVGVVRIGDTVRRPHQPSSAGVAAYLSHLERVGFARSPRYLGTDELGRDALSFLDGDVPGDPVAAWAAVDRVLPGVAWLVRALHDASEGYQPVATVQPERRGRPPAALPDGEARVVSQRDVTPQNVVFRDGEAWGLIDFDLSDWTTRSIDLANTAMHWVPLCDPRDRGPAFARVDVSGRLRLMLDAYGRDRIAAAQLLDAAALRFGAGYESMRWNAVHLGGGWRRMWDEGVGEVIRRRVAWFDSVRDELAADLSRGEQPSGDQL